MHHTLVFYCLTPDDFTPLVESAATQWVNEMLMGGGGGGIVTVTLYFNAILPVRISVHRRTRRGVAPLQSVFSWAEFCFKNWAIVLRLSLNNISESLHMSYHSFYFIPLVHLSINS
jgi:hypothetical protein